MVIITVIGNNNNEIQIEVIFMNNTGRSLLKDFRIWV
jgi:hypothetical protein